LKLLFCVLWLFDTLFTSLLVARDGVAAEANPLVAPVIAHHGLPGLWLVKALVLALLLWSDWLYYKREKKRISYLVYLFLSAAMLAPVAWGGFRVLGEHGSLLLSPLWG
jgi:hypothetical protein